MLGLLTCRQRRNEQVHDPETKGASAKGKISKTYLQYLLEAGMIP